jgi:hypothetical protein
VKTALISGIADCVEARLRKRALRFLQGLSADELQYIAEFLGACMLEPAPPAVLSRRQLSDGIACFDRNRGTVRRRDRQHKMVILLECLWRFELNRLSLPAFSHSGTSLAKRYRLDGSPFFEA